VRKARGFTGLAWFIAVALGCNGYTKVQETPPGRMENVPGRLPPTAQDTTGTGLYTYMESVQWTPPKTVKMCTSMFYCFVHLGPKVDVDLEVIQGSYVVDPRHVPDGGALLVKAYNHGPQTSYHYKLKAKYLYALIAYPDFPGAKTSHWILKEIDSLTHIAHTVPGVHGPFSPCWDYPAGTVDDVDLYKCGEAHSGAAIKTSRVGLLNFLEHIVSALQFGEESPIWKSCPAGCCTLAEA